MIEFFIIVYFQGEKNKFLIFYNIRHRNYVVNDVITSSTKLLYNSKDCLQIILCLSMI